MTNELHTALEKMQEILDREVTRYKSDFIWDISFIMSQSTNGYNQFCWFTRDTGTQICRVDNPSLIDLYKDNNKKMYYVDTLRGEVTEVWRSEEVIDL